MGEACGVLIGMTVQETDEYPKVYLTTTPDDSKTSAWIEVMDAESFPDYIDACTGPLMIEKPRRWRWLGRLLGRKEVKVCGAAYNQARDVLTQPAFEIMDEVTWQALGHVMAEWNELDP